MNQPAPDPALPRRSNADYRWTRGKAVAFLHALGERGSVAGAARRVGMSRKAAYALRARLGADFSAIWAEAATVGRDVRKRRRRALLRPQGDTFGRPR